MLQELLNIYPVSSNSDQDNGDNKKWCSLLSDDHILENDDILQPYVNKTLGLLWC